MSFGQPLALRRIRRPGQSGEPAIEPAVGRAGTERSVVIEELPVHGMSDERSNQACRSTSHGSGGFFPTSRRDPSTSSLAAEAVGRKAVTIDRPVERVRIEHMDRPNRLRRAALRLRRCRAHALSSRSHPRVSAADGGWALRLPRGRTDAHCTSSGSAAPSPSGRPAVALSYGARDVVRCLRPLTAAAHRCPQAGSAAARQPIVQRHLGESRLRDGKGSDRARAFACPAPC